MRQGQKHSFSSITHNQCSQLALGTGAFVFQCQRNNAVCSPEAGFAAGVILLLRETINYQLHIRSPMGTPWPWEGNMVGPSWAVPRTQKNLFSTVLPSDPFTLTPWLHTDSSLA